MIKGNVACCYKSRQSIVMDFANEGYDMQKYYINIIP